LPELRRTAASLGKNVVTPLPPENAELGTLKMHYRSIGEFGKYAEINKQQADQLFLNIFLTLETAGGFANLGRSLGRLSASVADDIAVGGLEAPNSVTSYSRVMARKHYDSWKAGKTPIGGEETWITYTDDLVEFSSSRGVAQRLTLLDDTGNLRKNDYVRVDFLIDDLFSAGLRNPIETVPARGYGFRHGGFTQGGANDLLMNPDAPITILNEVPLSPWR
jgi:hypothetical protein